MKSAPSRSKWACLAVASALALVPASTRPVSAAAQDIPLAAHRAVYDLRLAQGRGKQSVESARGRILYDFTGNRCEGYALQFRQVTELDSGEGKSVVSDLRTTNWEEGSGKSFRFTSQNFLDRKPVESAEGSAERGEASVKVTLTKPQQKEFDAGNVFFPSDHLRQIIAAARDGKPLLELGVYDGAENGERIYNSLTVIGQRIAPNERVPTDAAAGQQALAGMTRWPVTVSYFERGKSDGDQTPAYALSFELYENGIARAVKLDYGDFVLDGELTSLELRESGNCP